MTRRWRRQGAAVSALLVAATVGAAPSTSEAGEASATAANSCPLDMGRWGPLSGAGGERGSNYYRQAHTGTTTPSFWLPQQIVTAGQKWSFSFALTVEAPSGAAQAQVDVDWYSTPAGDNSGYLGQGDGPWTNVPVGAGRTTKIAHTFTVPAGAVRANVITKVRAENADNTLTGRSCDYRLNGSATAASGSPPATSPPATPSPDPATPTPAAEGEGEGSPAAPGTDPQTDPATPATDPQADPAAPATPGANPPSGGGVTAASVHGWGEPIAEASDEFDYGSGALPALPNPAKWNLAGEGEDACGPGHNDNGRRCAKNTTVAEGVLSMVGEANGDSGWLGSRFAQRYGRSEARVRSEKTGDPGGENQYHPLLILWPENDEWPEGAEYDFLENSSPGEDCIAAFIHYPHPEAGDRIEQEHEEQCDVDLTQWHNVAIEWTPDHVKGFVDGEEWFSVSGGADDFRACIQCAPGPMFQTIQLDNFHGTDMESALYQVDWVRTYALPGAAAADGSAESAESTGSG